MTPVQGQPKNTAKGGKVLNHLSCLHNKSSSVFNTSLTTDRALCTPAVVLSIKSRQTRVICEQVCVWLTARAVTLLGLLQGFQHKPQEMVASLCRASLV